MLILASASPRRQELLRNAGIEFVVHPTDIAEIPEPGETPDACAERLAREKASAIAHLYPGRLILGADTIVVVDGEMLGKPADAADAARMLRLLSGQQHEVITGVCLIGPGFQDVSSETTAVEFSELTEAEIAFYVSSREPMDKAGAYAIQGIASRWIPRIKGDYSNVVGLPVALVYKLLRSRGALK
ncbi:MAG: septum formation inhibitor Maf [Acidobacteria bacterium]|jgi:septum formation protein|nr:MAG: septum formation inhibitor Maf [Acidobacteriota bacterium]